MSKALLSLELEGKYHTYSFHFYGDTEDIVTWEYEGFKVEEVVHTEEIDLAQHYSTSTAIKH
jgi:hypothetical protein